MNNPIFLKVYVRAVKKVSIEPYQKKMIIIRIIQEFVEKYKYTEAEGIMLGAFISAGLWTIILYFIF